jgi:catechol 2,3-dioxygenase-like lactoylglutathione lyase family enzyme
MEEVPRPANFDFEGAWLRKGGAEIHLVQANEAVQPAGDAPTNPTERRDLTFARHMSFGVGDINEAIRSLEENGISIVKGPRPRGDGAVQLYCHDPDGHLIELTSKESQ